MFPQGICDQMWYHVFQTSRFSMCPQLKIQFGVLAHWRHSQLQSRILTFLHFLNPIDEWHLSYFEYGNLDHSIIWFLVLLSNRPQRGDQDGWNQVGGSIKPQRIDPSKLKLSKPSFGSSDTVQLGPGAGFGSGSSWGKGSGSGKNTPPQQEERPNTPTNRFSVSLICLFAYLFVLPYVA